MHGAKARAYPKQTLRVVKKRVIHSPLQDFCTRRLVPLIASETKETPFIIQYNSIRGNIISYHIKSPDLST